MKHINFYLDFISPYAYLAFEKLPQALAGLSYSVAYKPVLFAAMPTGANAFLFSQRNNEATAAVSGAIALGTALAAISASILLYLMDTGAI